MLAVLSKYKALLIIFAIIILAAAVWLFISLQSNGKVPSKGVFVSGNAANIHRTADRTVFEGGSYPCSRL